MSCDPISWDMPARSCTSSKAGSAAAAAPAPLLPPQRTAAARCRFAHAHGERLGHRREAFALRRREAGGQRRIALEADRGDRLEDLLARRTQDELGAQAGALDQAHALERLHRATDLRLLMARERDQRIGRQSAHPADHGDELAIERIQIDTAPIVMATASRISLRSVISRALGQAQVHGLIARRRRCCLVLFLQLDLPNLAVKAVCAAPF